MPEKAHERPSLADPAPPGLLGVAGLPARTVRRAAGPARRPRDRGWGRTVVPNGKNDRAVKSAFQETLAAASSATVRIRADGQDVALGAVVDADGYLVSKASLLEGKLTCRFKDGTEKEARIVGQDDTHDLALLRVDAANLAASPGGTAPRRRPAVSWPPPGRPMSR